MSLFEGNRDRVRWDGRSLTDAWYRLYVVDIERHESNQFGVSRTVNIINNKQNTTYPFSKNIYIVYYQRVMSRKSGVWSGVGDDRKRPKKPPFLRGRGEKIGKDFCLYI